MPWKERTVMSEREELVRLALTGEVSLAALCRRFGVSRKTGYKWLGRHAEQGVGGLDDRSRRPKRCPGQTPPEIETAVVTARREHPAWGGRKIHHWLVNSGESHVPAPSTITTILGRHGLLSDEARKPLGWQRFEAERPNELWQMDFKGHFATATGRCHPLTALDDHSRFNIVLRACNDERAETVRQALTHAFERYGLPEGMLMDNGSPWGNSLVHPQTYLSAWLIRQGITVHHGRPHHPQTQGKEERFHRTLKAEVLSRRATWTSNSAVQDAFTPWRDIYNFERPHEALDHQPPITRYRPSPRTYSSSLPPIEYAPDDQVRKVQDLGFISFRGREYRISRAFVGQPIALRPHADGVWDVFYCHQRVGKLDLRSHTTDQITDPSDGP